MHILCISPYPGLNLIFQRLVRDNSALLSQFSFDFIDFDRHNNRSIIENILQHKHFDAIISRGGTATLVEKLTDLPVIDIGVSQYDLLSILKSAKNLTNSALVAFQSVTQKTSEIVQRFNLSIKTFTIHKNSELRPLFLNLQTQQIDTIICDTMTEAVAKEFGFNTILITSSDESVINAIAQTTQLLKQQKNNLDIIHLYKFLLDNQIGPVIVLNNTGTVVYYSNIFSDDKQLFSAALHAFQHQQKSFQHQKIQYIISSNNSEPPFTIISVVKRTLTNHPISNNLVAEYENSEINKSFALFYQLTQGDTFFNMVKSYAHSNQIIVLIGESGTGKIYISSVLHQAGHNAQHEPFIFDSQDTDCINDAITKIDSPLYTTERTLIFPNFNEASIEIQDNLINFIQESRLFKRNQIIITLNQTIEEGITKPIKSLLENSKIITLPSLRDISGDKISKVIATIINDYNRSNGTSIAGISDITLDFILSSTWEQNYLEFYQVLQIAMAMTTGTYIGINELRTGIEQYHKQHYLLNQSPTLKQTTHVGRIQTLSDIIYTAVVQALDSNKGNRTKTAQQLNISRATLWRYLKRN